jgi:hypothetical protein
MQHATYRSTASAIRSSQPREHHHARASTRGLELKSAQVEALTTQNKQLSDELKFSEQKRLECVQPWFKLSTVGAHTATDFSLETASDSSRCASRGLRHRRYWEEMDAVERGKKKPAVAKTAAARATSDKENNFSQPLATAGPLHRCPQGPSRWRCRMIKPASAFGPLAPIVAPLRSRGCERAAPLSIQCTSLLQRRSHQAAPSCGLHRSLSRSRPTTIASDAHSLRRAGARQYPLRLCAVGRREALWSVSTRAVAQRRQAAVVARRSTVVWQRVAL